MDLSKVQFGGTTCQVQASKMKSVTLVVLLAVTLGYAAVDAASRPQALFTEPDDNLEKPRVLLASKNSDNDRLLSSTYHRVDRSHRVAHNQEIVIRLVEYARITRVEGWGGSDSVLKVLDGGLGHNFIKLGYGTEEEMDFNYRFYVYGYLVCDD
ncbi:uncharacterized protein LOC118277288 [Spodoptera frugiperda]|uniref:Uncharacterized protein LOC118277288 n=1 Tax=Spodoptera frugiperda TaxID=7108 RepID=A0A9R0EQX5_SPOFR|nr:uncharacterized protein LOC118277288 [Spodoptera frugiperda]